MGEGAPDERATGKAPQRKRLVGGALLLLGLGALSIVLAWPYRDRLRLIEPWIEQHETLGALIYVLAGAASVVLLPFSSLPLLPLATRVWGVWGAAALSALGWWLGALIAFWVARAARPSLERFVSLAALDRIERAIPPDIGFAGIVLLRVLLPVDGASFALGLLRDLSFKTYALASLLGLLPFAFVWSYAGGKLASGQYLSFAVIAAVLIGVAFLARRYWLGKAERKGPAD